MRFESTLTIAAPIERVWELTLDVEGLPGLTPTMTSVTRLDDGPLRVGSRTRIVQPRQRPAVWVVDRIEAPRLFAWHTAVMGIAMVAGHHLEPVDGGCRNTLTLEVSGLGSKVFGRLIGRQIRAALATENEGFRRAAEAAPPTGA